MIQHIATFRIRDEEHDDDIQRVPQNPATPAPGTYLTLHEDWAAHVVDGKMYVVRFTGTDGRRYQQSVEYPADHIFDKDFLEIVFDGDNDWVKLINFVPFRLWEEPEIRLKDMTHLPAACCREHDVTLAYDSSGDYVVQEVVTYVTPLGMHRTVDAAMQLDDSMRGDLMEGIPLDGAALLNLVYNGYNASVEEFNGRWLRLNGPSRKSRPIPMAMLSELLHWTQCFEALYTDHRRTAALRDDLMELAHEYTRIVFGLERKLLTQNDSPA